MIIVKQFEDGIRVRSAENTTIVDIIALGISKEDISINIIQDDVVPSLLVTSDNDKYMKLEHVFSLSNVADIDNISATTQDGILTIIIPNKKKEDYIKKIKIN